PPRSCRRHRTPARRCAGPCDAPTGGPRPACECGHAWTWRGAGGFRSCSSSWFLESGSALNNWHLLLVWMSAMDGLPRAGSAHLSLLGFLQVDLLAGIAHTLALVGLRRTEAADLGCHLPHRLLVRALDQDFGLRRGLDADAFRRIEYHRVGKAQAQVQRLALH